MELTREQIAALTAYRAEHGKNWQARLTEAWLNDWREQWGELRTIRNSVGIAEAFQAFRAHESQRVLAGGAPHVYARQVRS